MDDTMQGIATTEQRIPLGTVWQWLVSGRIKIKRTQQGFERCFVTLTVSTDQTAPSALAVKVAAFVLSGQQPKVVAVELAISQATVCHYCRSVLDAFSDNAPMSRASMFAVMCACAAQGMAIPAAQDHGINQDGDTVLSVELPDDLLTSAGLSNAELSVAWARILGKTLPEICAERRTSPRTIANQLNAIHRKLRVSGRREFLAAVLTYPGRQVSSDAQPATL